MKIHPLVWLSIADYKQRHGTLSAVLFLYGTSHAIQLAFDVPLLSHNQKVTAQQQKQQQQKQQRRNDEDDHGVIDAQYLITKLKQLNEIFNKDSSSDRSRLLGFVILGDVFNSATGNESISAEGNSNSSAVHALATEKILAQLMSLEQEMHGQVNKLFNMQSDSIYILEIKEQDFADQVTENFLSKLYRFTNRTDHNGNNNNNNSNGTHLPQEQQQLLLLVLEKLVIESSDSEKSAINSIVNDAGSGPISTGLHQQQQQHQQLQTDNLRLLNSVIVAKQQSLGILERKFDEVIEFLQQKTSSRTQQLQLQLLLDQDYETVVKIGSLVSMLDAGDELENNEDSVKNSFEQKDVNSHLVALLALMNESLLKGAKLVSKNVDYVNEL